MARPNKVGLEYFPFDTTFYDDIKIRKLIRYHGGGAVSVYTFLLCTIYRSGYFIKWDKDLAFIISERTGFDEDFINLVIQCCLENGLFSQEQLDRNKILTGKGVQSRYELVCKMSKRSTVINPEFTCINTEETPIITEETLVNSEEIPVKSESSAQRKVKERKEKKSKEGVVVKRDSIFDFMPPSIEAIQAFVLEKYKSSRQAAKEFAEHFYNYYSDRDWTIKGGDKMKKWESAISGPWKKEVDRLMELHPKSMEIDEDLDPEIKLERERRKTHYENGIAGAPHETGHRREFSDFLSKYHLKFGYFNELKPDTL